MFTTKVYCRHLHFQARRRYETPQSLLEQFRVLETKQLTQPDKEFARLNKNNIIRLRMEKLQSDVNFSFPNLYHRIAFARSLELYHLVNQTHYVLHHAQSGLNYLALNILTKMLFNQTSATSFLKHQTVMRHFPNRSLANENLRPVEWYKKRMDGTKLVDHAYTDSLISADLYLASTANQESAFDYFVSPIF